MSPSLKKTSADILSQTIAFPSKFCFRWYKGLDNLLQIWPRNCKNTVRSQSRHPLCAHVARFLTGLWAASRLPRFGRFGHSCPKYIHTVFCGPSKILQLVADAFRDISLVVSIHRTLYIDFRLIYKELTSWKSRLHPHVLYPLKRSSKYKAEHEPLSTDTC
jgi:hypothetical protein